MTNRTARGLFAAIFLLGASLLCIRLGDDWRCLHEDNGAFHTTHALGHLKLGLKVTKGYAFFVDRVSGETEIYGHHPPAVSLALAAVFRLTGSTAPAAARGMVIAFHLGSLLVMARLLFLLFPPAPALAGTFAFAVLPMSAYFGRMVNYEPPCFFGVSLALLGFVGALRGGSRRGLWLLAGGLAFSGLVDWPAFFFAAAIGSVGAWSAFRGDVSDVSEGRAGRAVFLVAAGTSIAVLAFDLVHLGWASGSVGSLLAVVRSSAPHGETPLMNPASFLAGQFDSFRRYFTHTGLVASAFAAALVFAPRAKAARDLFAGEIGTLRRKLLVASGGAALTYVLAAPSWASVHPYWKFYFLPFVATGIALLFDAVGRLSPRAAFVLRALLLLEMTGTSAYMLHLRHTREGAYAVEMTETLRARYLRPGDERR